MCDYAVDNYAHAIVSVLDCHKTRKICNKALSTYPSGIQFAPDQFKAQEMCDKAVDTVIYLILFLIDV